MDIDLLTLSEDRRYKLLTALVIPRPIAWITTESPEGLVNVAPFSFFNVLGNEPPLVAFGPSERAAGVLKDTPRNIAATGEFVVNLVDPGCLELMHQTASALPADVSEAEAVGLQLVPSVSVKPPRLAVSQVSLECRHERTIEIGDNRVVFGIIQHLHVQDGIVDPTTLRTEPGAFVAVGRLQGPGNYCTTRDLVKLGPYPAPAELMQRVKS